ncbi:unnamed protein product [Boreogadus saida]
MSLLERLEILSIFPLHGSSDPLFLSPPLCFRCPLLCDDYWGVRLVESTTSSHEDVREKADPMGGSSFIVVKTFLPAGGLPSSLVWFPALDPRPQTRGPARCELVPCPGSQTTDQGTSPV